jgi:SnoaL-like domain
VTDPGQVGLAIATRLQLEDLNRRFAWQIDHERGRGVEELFTEDGRYSIGDDFELVGRRRIAEFYEQLRARGVRTSRHLCTNLHLAFVDETHATGTCLVTLYAADGSPPLPPPERPLLIADCADSYVLGPDAVWRLESRSLPIIFGRWPWSKAGVSSGA